ncbi:MAG: prepilin-type N-terminal cleavage/methylation domain-containing protein [Candidatus Gygaella obscura]|nr:prepilin-type N-terminal cleavage/methylation domain-containing protein [Candidatus Gygaella obscura]
MSPFRKSPLKAFTLLELIIVVIVVSIIAAAGIAQYPKTIEKAREAEARSILGAMRNATIAYFIEHGKYPTAITDLPIDVPSDCAQSSHWFLYILTNHGGANVILTGDRCNSGGKYPPLDSRNDYYVRMTLDGDLDWVDAATGPAAGSCPFVYAFNGEKYEFVNETIPFAGLGHPIGRGVYNTPDPDEYLRSDFAFVPKEGSFSIKYHENFGEVDYIDKSNIIVIDHPKDIEVFSNERTSLLKPLPKYKIWQTKDLTPPVSAVDDDGNDILNYISKRDNIHVPLLTKGEGVNSIILNLGNLTGAEGIQLLIYGRFIHPLQKFSEMSIHHAFEHKDILSVNTIEVIDENGDWSKVIPEDSTKPLISVTMSRYSRYTVLDLTNAFKTNDFRVRLTSSLETYYDQIMVNTFTDYSPLQITILEPEKAIVDLGGVMPRSEIENAYGYFGYYDYDDIDKNVFAKQYPGSYTRYGDVLELLKDRDDKFVIMGYGDEITLEFDSSSLPAVPPGYERRFFVYTYGFSKELPTTAGVATTVKPLPFSAMSSFPYKKSEKYPQDVEHVKYLEEFNNRIVGK